ncbi:hypothetical protein [Methylorubrum extorquens]|uniref:hypothetical protein n=1 Tax=Methylorubrum extorquens TaxID=408 RepID=UPI001EE5206F|nr:hypothetical protein [Methylorubrum extorquens]MCG5249207.1 hypothetical protein [Methylorubrum extorquens]
MAQAAQLAARSGPWPLVGLAEPRIYGAINFCLSAEELAKHKYERVGVIRLLEGQEAARRNA